MYSLAHRIENPRIGILLTGQPHIPARNEIAFGGIHTMYKVHLFKLRAPRLEGSSFKTLDFRYGRGDISSNNSIVSPLRRRRYRTLQYSTSTSTVSLLDSLSWFSVHFKVKIRTMCKC
jgi:hypothetical protein